MAKKRKRSTSAETVREVIRLSIECDLPHRKIAEACGVSHVTVGFYLKLASTNQVSLSEVRELNDQDLMGRLKSEAPKVRNGSKPEPDFIWIHQELSKKGVTKQLLWEEYKEQHPDGYQSSQFNDLYNRWKSTLHTWMRQDHKAGEKLFIDYAGHTLQVKNPITGEFRKAQIFVAVLGFSNYTYVEATWDQSVPSWIGSHIRAFEFFGGVPRILVPDNLKAAVIKAGRYESQIHPVYQDLATHYSTAVIPARVRKPKDKAKAEVAVQVVERWILAALRNHTFFSLEALNREIQKLLIHLNKKRFKKLKGSRLIQFDTLEKPQLGALPQERFEICEWKNARVNIDYHIELDRHYYSVPYKLVQQEVRVRFTPSTVEIFHQNTRVASHKRCSAAGYHTTIKEHMPKSHQEHLEWTPSRMQKWALSIGKSTESVITGILHSRAIPEQGYRACLGILRLSKRYSNERLEAACKRALSYDALKYSAIANILDKGLDQINDEPQKEQPPQQHENLRGSHYFQSSKK